MARKKTRALPELSETLAEQPDPDDPEATTLELDELWSFVLKKTRKRWIWLALCRKTRQVVAYFIGDRSEASCRKLWERVPKAYRGGRCYSDFSGRRIGRSSPKSDMRRWARRAERRHMWRDGTTL